MNLRFLLCGIFIALLWNTNNVGSVFVLTTTLMTGFVGGFLIGKMTLGTFLGLLSTNGTSLPQLQLPQLPQIPSVNLSSIRLPSFPTLIPREGSQDVPASDISDTFTITSTTSQPVPPTMPPTQAAPVIQYQYVMPTPQNMPYVYTYNYPVPYPYPYQQTYTYATTRRPQVYQYQSLKPQNVPIQPIDVPVSLDNKVRDRFIRQLAIMDPLNCLPKIFCEVSADPYGATFLLNYGSISNVGPLDESKVTPDEIEAYEHRLHMQKYRATSTTPRPTTTTTTTTTTTPATVQNDAEEEHADSQSASEEDEEEEEEDDISISAEDDISEEEDDDSFEQYRKEHEHKIEMQALEEMVDETEDPETYMFILRDKQRRKAARKRYKEKQRNKLALALQSSQAGPPPFGRGRGDFPVSGAEADPMQLSPYMYGTSAYNQETSFVHRISEDPPRPPPPMEPPTFLPPLFKRSTEAPVQDMFADDPFFDDFPSASGRSSRAFKLEFKSDDRSKRVKRQSFRKADLMRIYRLAYMVAEKYKNPEVCNTAFPSCPYRAETILSVVNRMESGLLPFHLSSDKKEYFHNKNNIVHFKNTLQAIERLNKATLHAQARGEPIDIEEMTEAAANPSSKIEASTSQNIVNEFQQVVAKIKTAKLKKKKKHKRRKHVKNQTKYDAVHYYKKAQMDTLKPKERVKTGIFTTREAIRQQDDELQTYKKWGKVPSFKQTYKDMFKTSKMKKRRPKSKNRSRSNIPEPSATYHQSKVKGKTKSEPLKTFSNTGEDDEKDAEESEEAVDALIHGSMEVADLQ